MLFLQMFVLVAILKYQFTNLILIYLFSPLFISLIYNLKNLRLSRHNGIN